MLCIYTPQKIGYENLSTKAHYSLTFDAERLLRLFRNAGHDAVLLPVPDVFASQTAKCFINDRNRQNEKYIYICVSSWDEARLFPFADNSVFYLAWEQPEIYNPQYTRQFGINMLETLKSFDSVWAIAGYLNDSLKEYKINSLHFPTPICKESKHQDTVPLLFIKSLYRFRQNIFSPYLFYASNMSIPDTVEKLPSSDHIRFFDILRKRASGDTNIKIFLTQGNLIDLRKNVLGVMIGFSLFAAENPNSFLIVKTAPGTRYEILNSMLPLVRKYIRWGWWGCQNIFILPGAFLDDELIQLYSIADYYICAPITEGQNIPLQEAIQNGCYPITPIHSAMREYLKPCLVSEIASKKKYYNPVLYCNAPLNQYTGYYSSFTDIADACQNAIDTEKKYMNEAIRSIQTQYLHKYTYTGLATRLSEILGEN